MDNYGFLRIGVAVPVVKLADVESNKSEICTLSDEAEAKGVSVLAFPELSLTGASCGDLYAQTSLLDAVEGALEQIRCHSRGKLLTLLVGAPIRYHDRLYNCVVVIRNGRIRGIVPKIEVAASGDQAQSRWFCSGRTIMQGVSIDLNGHSIPFYPHQIFTVGGVKFAVGFGNELTSISSPTSFLARMGAQIVFLASAENDFMYTHERRKMLLSTRSWMDQAGYIYCGTGHGESTQDLVHGGDALVYENGKLVVEGKRFQFQSELTVADIDVEKLKGVRLKNLMEKSEEEGRQVLQQDLGEAPSVDFKKGYYGTLDPMPFIPENEKVAEEAVELQVTGLASRLEHIGHPEVIVGVSGGLDSTLALLIAALAFDRLGWDRKGIVGVTMPGFGTSGRTYNNALDFMTCLGIAQQEISIVPAVTRHFEDIHHPMEVHDVTYENSQARERTQILMDIANKEGGIVLGTGDLSELALGWATYNGDHMSMYGINASVPKTLVRHLVRWIAENRFLTDKVGSRSLSEILMDVIDTPVSPELTPADDQGKIAQKTEDIVGPYELHDFFLYQFYHFGFGPKKIYFLAQHAFDGKEGRPYYEKELILKFLKKFYWRFFTQQFKRSCLPDGPKISEVSLSPRGGYSMPSDAKVELFIKELEEL